MPWIDIDTDSRGMTSGQEVEASTGPEQAPYTEFRDQGGFEDARRGEWLGLAAIMGIYSTIVTECQ